MAIVLDWDDDVQRYAQAFADLRFPRLPTCSHCADPAQLVGHGSYPRTVSDPTGTIPIRVKRFLCRACHRTLSLLPTFCLPFRHYATATIQAVLAIRVDAQASWSTVRRRFAPSDLPTRTTCREWVAAFHAASSRYLPALLHQLATWARRSVALEVALADLARVSATAAQLIAAVPHLLSWLTEAGHPVVDGGRRWLASLWEWGNGAKLGRLV